MLFRSESLDSLGLDLSTAGEIVGIRSDKELGIINDVEVMIRARVDFEGLPLSSESIKKLQIECGMMCHGTSLDPDSVFSDAIGRVENAL